MSAKTDARRAALRDRLIAAAEAQISAGGLRSLRARDLAAEAGCAVGSIYSVFGDLPDLVLAVNARTFEALGEALGDAVPASVAEGQDQPLARLIAMARAYHRFAATHRPRWRALFEIDRPPGEAAPDWYLARMEGLLARNDGAVAALMPELDPDQRRDMVRTLFSAVHGIVWLGLDEASVGVPEDRIDDAIAALLTRIAGRAG